VEAGPDTNACERFLAREAFFDLGEDGHERSGPFDTRTALISEAPVFDIPELLIDELQVNDSFDVS
jgi:hypothetical protein